MSRGTAGPFQSGNGSGATDDQTQLHQKTERFHAQAKTVISSSETFRRPAANRRCRNALGDPPSCNSRMHMENVYVWAMPIRSRLPALPRIVCRYRHAGDSGQVLLRHQELPRPANRPATASSITGIHAQCAATLPVKKHYRDIELSDRYDARYRRHHRRKMYG